MGVVVVGSLNVDLAADVDLLPRPGETVASTGPLRRSAGGKGLNQAIAAARQGVATRLAGAVGDDDDGRMLLALLRAEGLETEAIVTSRSSSTGTALITVDARGDNTIVVVAGANGTLAPPASAQLAVGPGDVVLAQLEVPITTVTAVLTRAHGAGGTTILNASPALALPDELAAAVDLLVVNEHELATTGLGRRTTIVTLGALGARLHRDPTAPPTPVPPFAVESVDTTGAGDAFAGTLAASLSLGHGLDDALRRASAAGALTATRPGAAAALPTQADVTAVLR